MTNPPRAASAVLQLAGSYTQIGKTAVHDIHREKVRLCGREGTTEEDLSASWLRGTRWLLNRATISRLLTSSAPMRTARFRSKPVMS